ncbi:alpha/beta hydrolase [Rosistilla oblonga]|uniref:alpha/beta hydrolase n=1 Tax=Rosistilla oblonga TaxID=2527990 RepID=UPI003A978296
MMKLKAFLFAPLTCLILSATVVADSPEPKPLWKDGAPGAGGDQVGDLPNLTIYKAAGEGPRPAIVVLPGGGYGGLAIDHEGYAIANWLQDLGVTAAICQYRHRGKGNQGAGYKHPYPLMDAQRAIRTLRAQAAELNIDPNRIGILGFSAGGHLASTAATHFDDGNPDASDPIDRVSCRPDFAVLCYAVIGLNKPYTHRGSQRNLLGEDAPEELVESLSNESQVTEKTPPIFLLHTSEDTAVPPQNSIHFYLACHKHKVPVELHIFEKGRHGLGLAAGRPGAEHWPMLCHEWMISRGILPAAK